MANPHGYEKGFTIEQHRDELIARLGNAIKRINELESQLSALQWVEVTPETMPDEGLMVLGWYLGHDLRYREIVMCYWQEESRQWRVDRPEPKWNHPRITHWQPLPPPPATGLKP